MGGVAASAKQATRARAKVVTLPARRPLAARFVPSARSLLVGFALLAGSLGSYFVAHETPLFAVREIAVTGVQPRAAARIQTALGSFEGTSLVALDGAELAARAGAIPEVHSVNYDRAFPHTLRVVVRPERPLLVLRRGSEAWLVSARARVIGGIARRTRLGLPRFWVPKTVELEAGAFVTDARTLLALAPLRVLEDLDVRLSPRGVKIDEAGQAALRLRSGVEVRLGRPVDLGLKLTVAERVLPELRPRRGYIDVSVPDRPVAGVS